MKTFEQLLPDEEGDIREIVDGILHQQAKYARDEHRGLERGTHAKGVCVRGTFEVLDLANTVEDPILRARLSQGLFAKPGAYPAVIRFANASSQKQADYTKDVRAVSFAVSVPSAGPGPAVMRHDFSLNNATTFPIDNAHTFATLMRVRGAAGAWRKLRALMTLSPADWWGLIKTGAHAKKQLNNTVRPYQRQRYWSTVPFRHGPNDAIKQSIIPKATNPAGEPAQTADTLRDDLLRQLQVEDRDIEFDFAVQFLDADAMRYRFRKRGEIWWVENAAVEWPEAQAPFHVIGRLRVLDGSQLSDEETRAFYIDVNEYCTPDSRPLGSINRARRFAEAASRRARLGLPADESGSEPGAPLPPKSNRNGTWLGGLTIRSLAKAAAIAFIAAFVLSGAFAFGAMLALRKDGIPLVTPDDIVYADNGWGAGLHAPSRQAYYYTAQGAGLKDVRYSWFVNLEIPWGQQRISDPAVMSRFGFLVDERTAANPDRLPVGFAKHFDQSLSEVMLDITCAACHTGQIEVTTGGRTRALRIDGGQANHAFTDASEGNFVPTMVLSMATTLSNPLKFNRFAKRVLGPTYPEGYFGLYWELGKVFKTFGGIGLTEKMKGLSPTNEGYGRTDALARIGNTVFAENLGVEDNYAVGNAPVNFPSLWNIWKFDWVQYNASVSQPMARNIGEAMGVGAKYALFNPYGGPLPESERFRSTARISALDTIERTLWKLNPPAWNPEILGKVDSNLAAKGQALFTANCAGCHGPYLATDAIKQRNAPGKMLNSDPEWLVATLCADDIGTDPNAAHNFSTRRVNITRTGMTAQELRAVAGKTESDWNRRMTTYLTGEIARLRPARDSASIAQRRRLEKELADLPASTARMLDQIDPANMSMGAALSYLGTMIRDKAYVDGHYTPEQQAAFDGFGAMDRPQVLNAYKARPLAGVWATPPFLHNGSVPTIYDLLSPPDSRPDSFQVGSREYDPVKLGLAPVQGFLKFTTADTGNHNTGHEFGPGYDPTRKDRQPRRGLIGRLLTHDEKMAILEHLKIRNDDSSGTQELHKLPACRPY